MPFQTTAQGSKYSLIAFANDGRERSDDPDGVNGQLSTRIIEDISHDTSVTDVFLLSHGWMGDVPTAIDQYNRWIGAMNALGSDRARMIKLRPGFKPLWIAVHWPSKPWGNEEFGGAGAAFSAPYDPIDLYVERLGDRPGLREAIAVVVSEAARHPDATRLSFAAENAYLDINKLLQLGATGVGGSPGTDRKAFDPNVYFEAARQEASFGLGDVLDGVLAPLRQLSFWEMKQRACQIGETGMHGFLADLQLAFGKRDVRIHLMGHSFGCIVTSAVLCGPASGARPINPVDSLALVQGALSLWSYCSKIPVVPGQSGYFHKIGEAVAGPILTTRSIFDTANGRFYPLGAGVANQINFAHGELPVYGAIGSFGAQGLVPAAADMPMRAANDDYGFVAGQIYNLEASQFIRIGSGPAGAHNDISGREVAHAIWQAALPVAAHGD